MKINLKLIKRINNITNNIDILKLILESEYEGIILIIEELMYNLKEKYGLNQNIADSIAISYLKARIQGKDEICTLLTSQDFLTKISITHENYIIEFLAYIEENKNSLILKQNNVLTVYSIPELLEFIKIEKEITDKNDDIKIFTNGIKHGYPPYSIKVLIKELAEAQSINFMVLQEYLTDDKTYNAAYTDVLTIATLFNKTKDDNQLNTLTSIVKAKHWQNKVSFLDVYINLITYAFANKISLELLYRLEDLFNFRTIEEIKEMLEFIHAYKELNGLFLNENALRYLTWPELKSLCLDYHLYDARMLIKFLVILENTPESEFNNMYEFLQEQLEEVSYQVTIEEYLKYCKSIEELTNTLENKYPPEANITGQRLNLQKKIYEEN